MEQQIEFIEQCYTMGLCTEGEALDATVRLQKDTDQLWEEEMMKEQIEENKSIR